MSKPERTYPAAKIERLEARVLELEAELAAKDDKIDQLTKQLVSEIKIPTGYMVTLKEPDEAMWTAGRDPVKLRDMGFKVPDSMMDMPWRVNPKTLEIERDQSKGTTAVHVWRAMTADWLTRNPTYANPVYLP